MRYASSSREKTRIALAIGVAGSVSAVITNVRYGGSVIGAGRGYLAGLGRPEQARQIDRRDTGQPEVVQSLRLRPSRATGPSAREEWLPVGNP